MSDFFFGYLILSFFIATIHSFIYFGRSILRDKTITTRADVLFFILFPLTLIIFIFILLLGILLVKIKKSKITKWLKEPIGKE